MKNLEHTLLIGANGFFGTNIQEYLTSRNITFYQINGKNHLDIEVEGKLNNFLKKNKKIKSIINCSAFVGGVSYGYSYQANLLTKNSKMAMNIYEAALENNIKNIINPISNCIYPSSVETYKEEDMFGGNPHESVYFYAQSKRYTIYLAESYFQQYGLNSNNVILSNMYGPHDHFEEKRSHAVGAIVRKVLDAKLNGIDMVEIWGSGKQEREWLYVEDGVKAITKSFELASGCNTFNIGTNKTVSIKELAELIKIKSNWEGLFDYNTTKPEGVLKKSVDGNYGNNLISWSPKVNIEMGIEKTISWYLENL
jgi:GDP-L-fucose synthase